ncbi:MAG TPA: RecQ family ATP-dependent DNA helicase, partial [Candidatus Hydrogenedentes bacterium]|nr:RecQ family ATP-dependent DNA helicase [Candidatus Hydrogenedentota bacterium]
SCLWEQFPQACIHAYTVIATQRVRDDIIRSLRLEALSVLIGSFDRPNLTYWFVPRTNLYAQLQAIAARHRGQAGIVYCARRADVEQLSAFLKRAGYRSMPYHAGLGAEQRKRSQERFLREDDAIVAATVAFGMGIDKPDVRFVVHAAMPQSLEHYQQESGRAGRDGFPADCYLLFSEADRELWRGIQGSQEPALQEISDAKLAEMDAVCAGSTCRRRAILAYFGEQYPAKRCGACDVCLSRARDSALESSSGAILTLLHEIEPLAPPPASEEADWDEVLFEKLRRVRRDEARDRKLPAYRIFGDATLHDMVRKKPVDKAAFARVEGVGRQKCRDYWRVFCTAIREHLGDTDSANTGSRPVASVSAGKRPPSDFQPAGVTAHELFEQETSLEDACRQLGRSERWVVAKLEAFLRDTGRSTPYPWVDDETFARVQEAAGQVIGTRIKSIRQFAGDDLSETEIRLCLACLRDT